MTRLYYPYNRALASDAAAASVMDAAASRFP